MKILKYFVVICFLIFGTTTAQKAEIKSKNKIQGKPINSYQTQSKKALNEADIFNMYYAQETAKNDAKKQLLMREIRRNNKKAEVDLKKLNKTQKTLDTRKKKTVEFAKIRGRLGFDLDIIPPPPCPEPYECVKVWFENIDMIVVPDNVKNILVLLYGSKDEPIGRLDKKPVIINKQKGFKTYALKWIKKAKPHKIKVQKTLTNGLKEQYEINLN